MENKTKMNKEDKQLLLKDLCARLPYGVEVHLDTSEYGELIGILDAVYPSEERIVVDKLNKPIASLDVRCGGFLLNECTVKPYLRPMSSMTEKERNEWADKFNLAMDNLSSIIDEKEAEEASPYLFAECHSTSIDWLLSHHFDFRVLIEKWIALEAPEDMYN